MFDQRGGVFGERCVMLILVLWGLSRGLKMVIFYC